MDLVDHLSDTAHLSEQMLRHSAFPAQVDTVDHLSDSLDHRLDTVDHRSDTALDSELVRLSATARRSVMVVVRRSSLRKRADWGSISSYLTT